MLRFFDSPQNGCAIRLAKKCQTFFLHPHLKAICRKDAACHSFYGTALYNDGLAGTRSKLRQKYAPSTRHTLLPVKIMGYLQRLVKT